MDGQPVSQSDRQTDREMACFCEQLGGVSLGLYNREQTQFDPNYLPDWTVSISSYVELCNFTQFIH